MYESCIWIFAASYGKVKNKFNPNFDSTTFCSFIPDLSLRQMNMQCL